MKGNIRKPISKKIRFDVLKRDNFTCQYCSAKAPDVTLEVDHITPVCKGGGNNIDNLTTACYSCNRGKSGNLLTYLEPKSNYKTIQFKYGFIYRGVRHGWYKKKLFRLPFERNKRTFGLKEIPFYCFKATIVYNVQRTKLTINRLKFLTEKVDWNVEVFLEDEIPF